MDISIKATETHFVPAGKRLPAEFIMADGLEHDSYVLGAGTDEKEGQEAIITGLAYSINKKLYPLDGWGIKAIVTDSGVVHPVLRRAKGEENYAFQYVVREPHKLAYKEGDHNDWLLSHK
jgi:hypothetical protein